MNIPGFQAEASLGSAGTQDFGVSSATAGTKAGAVVPQISGCTPCIKLLGFGRKICCSFPPLSCSIKSC